MIPCIQRRHHTTFAWHASFRKLIVLGVLLQLLSIASVVGSSTSAHNTPSVFEKGVILPTTTLATPPNLSMSQCFTSLVVANAVKEDDDDDSLTAAEFVTFVTSLANNQTWSGNITRFTQLPLELQQVFLNRVDLTTANDSGKMSVWFNRPGQSSSSSESVSWQQVAALQEFCSDAILAVNQVNGAEEGITGQQPNTWQDS